MSTYHVHCGRELDAAGWCYHCKKRRHPEEPVVVTKELADSLRKLRDTMDAREGKRRRSSAKQNWGIRRKDPRVQTLL